MLFYWETLAIFLMMNSNFKMCFIGSKLRLYKSKQIMYALRPSYSERVGAAKIVHYKRVQSNPIDSNWYYYYYYYYYPISMSQPIDSIH